MNENAFNLIALTVENERVTVSARELHKFLESQERFSKWFERMKSYGLEESIDFNPYQKVQVQFEGEREVKREIDDYQLTIECAKEISMLQRNEKGKQARKYFIEVEKEWNDPTRIMARALSFAKKEIESLGKSIQIQNQVIGELKPKADYTDKILKSKSLVTITQIAKDYGMSGTEMNKLLHDLNVQYKQSGQWLLYREHQSKGYTHSETFDLEDVNKVVMTTKWTQKGRLFLYELLKTHGVLPLVEQENLLGER